MNVYIKCLNNFKKSYKIKKHLLLRLEKCAVVKEELEKELCTKVLTDAVLDYMIINYYFIKFTMMFTFVFECII